MNNYYSRILSLKPEFDDVLTLNRVYNVLKNKNQLASILQATLNEFSFDKFSKKQLLCILNEWILSNYEGESYFKNLLLSKYADDDAIAAYEIKTNGSRLDFLRINGHSISYEIKSERDNLAKIHKQISDYQKVFEYNYIVVGSKHLKTTRKLLPKKYGIITALDGELTFIRKASKNSATEPSKQLSMLNKKELKKAFNSTSTHEILKFFNRKEINGYFKQLLKDRYRKKWSF